MNTNLDPSRLVRDLVMLVESIRDGDEEDVVYDILQNVAVYAKLYGEFQRPLSPAEKAVMKTELKRVHRLIFKHGAKLAALRQRGTKP